MLSHVLGAVWQVLKPPPGGRSQLDAAHRPVDPTLVGARRLMTLAPDDLATHQSEECPRADHALLLKHYKTPHYPLQGGHSPWGTSRLCPLSAWPFKLVLLFPPTLSRGYYLAFVHSSDFNRLFGRPCSPQSIDCFPLNKGCWSCCYCCFPFNKGQQRHY